MPNTRPDERHFALNWQQQLAEAFTNIEDLCEYLEISPDEGPISIEACQNFPMRVPLSFAANMEKGNANDPLLRQVLPVADELVAYPGFTSDPVGDLDAAVHPGLLHKYHSRVLLINTGACAINCRYCFRRNFPYQDMQLNKQQESNVMKYIQSDASITEVILSGGDPLLLSDTRLGHLISAISMIQHVKRIRIHSRLPIVLPARITDELLEILSNPGKQTVLAVHCNHPNELNERVVNSINQLKRKGIILLNQAVLLRGVNDNADILCSLSETLFTHGILPYYLHVLDKAKGTGHFEIPKNNAKLLMNKVKNRLPGYLVPRLVEEIAGAAAKQFVA